MTTDSVYAPKMVTGTIAGPASYAAGGFLLDLSASLASVLWVGLVPSTIGAIGSVELEVAVDTDLAGALAQGKAVVKVLRDVYDKATVSAVTGQPGGVTVQAAKTATATATGSGHTHSINHDHASATSSVPTAGGTNGVAAAAGFPGVSTHTHAVDLPAFSGSSTSTTHTHQRSTVYEHGHGSTQAAADATLTEVAAATNLSGTTWRYVAVGFGDQ